MNLATMRVRAMVAALAFSVAVGGSAMAVSVGSADYVESVTQADAGFDQGLKIYLSDPELGVAGRYRQGNEVVYFQARRALDEKTGAPGQMALKFLDGQARLLAYAGQDLDRIEGVFKQGGTAGHHAAILAGLSDELGRLDLHPALSAEKSALADLAAAAGANEAVQSPYSVALTEAAKQAIDVSLVADFYLKSMADVRMRRGTDGTLSADLGGDLGFESRQFFLADEENEQGDLGRFDVYSRVVNGSGEHLGAELGGDFVLDEWKDIFAVTERRQRSHDELASEAGSAAMVLNGMSMVGGNSRGVSFGNDLEQAAMQRLAHALADTLLPVADVEAPGDAQAKSTGRYRTAIQVHRKWLVWPTEHSATRVSRHLFTTATSNVYSITGTINFCNHGTCPGGSGMTNKCSYTGPRMSHYRLPQQRIVPSGQTGAGTRHTCSTNYGVAGVLNHNCHDDSSVQVRAIKGQSYSHNGGRCRDWDFWANAPGC